MSSFTLSDQPSPAAKLLSACPFLEQHRTEYWDCGDTIIFGDVARLLRERAFGEDESDAVFACFNIIAEAGDDNDRCVLATGGLETFNDSAASQQLARAKLRGRALELLEDMRKSWGQPDHESGK